MSNSDYGFIVYGESGAIQIDGETVCANYAGSIQASTYVQSDMGIYYRGILGGLPNGMIFHDSPVPLSVRGWDTYFNARLIYSSSEVTARFFSFNDNRSSALGEYGLEVINSNGDLVFSSDWGPLKIVKVINITGNSPGVGDSASWDIPAGCVAALSTPTECMLNTGAHKASIFCGGLSVNGLVLSYSWMHMGTIDTWDDIRNQDIPYYYGYDSALPVQIIVAKLDYI